MMSMDLSATMFFTEGTPRTKGSFKVTKRGHFLPDNPDSIEMGERIRRMAAATWTLGPVAGPIAVTVWAYFRRPKGHFGTGRNAGKLKASAPEFPISKGRNDLDKILRLVLDALTGVVYEDDSQVCVLDPSKKLYVDDTQPLEGVLVGVRAF